MPDSSSKKGSSRGVDESRFLRAYSKSLAEALEANERGASAGGGTGGELGISFSSSTPPPLPSVSERSRDAYVALCHDDPVVSRGGDGACLALAESLVRGLAGRGRGEESSSKVGVDDDLREARRRGATSDKPPGDAAEDSLSSSTNEKNLFVNSGGVATRRRGGGGDSGGTTALATSAAEPRGMQLRGRRGTSAPSKNPLRQPRSVPNVGEVRGVGASSSVARKEETIERLALSDRLVAGVLQATDRTAPLAAAAATGSQPSPSPSSPADDAEAPPAPSHSFGFAEGSYGNLPATAEGYSLLFYSAFVRGPLLCLRASAAGDGDGSLEGARRFLGSYRGHSREPMAKTKAKGEESPSGDDDGEGRAVERLLDGMREMEVRDAEAKHSRRAAKKASISSKAMSIAVGDEEKKAEGRDSASSGNSSSSSGFFRSRVQQRPDKDKDNGGDDDDDSMKEIFAEESDPDDYEYDSCRYGDVAAAKGGAARFPSEDEFGSFDPAKMSAPPVPHLTSSQCRVRLDSLLSELSSGHAKLAAIPPARWEELGMSETLGELTTRLLKAELEAPGSRGGPLLRSEGPSDDDDDEESVDLAGRWHLPLEVLRDRSLDSRRRHDALGFYLDLILDLLSAPDNFGGAAATGKVEVSRTKAVALSSLSALCGPNGIPAASNCKSSDPSARLKIRNAIANSMDDLADAVEAVLPHKAKGGIGNSGESGGPPPPPLALPPWVNVTAHVLPVLQVLTWVRCLDLSPADSGGRGGGGGGAIGVSREGVSPREARSLLSSGLFRHLILLYAGTASSSASPHVVAGDGAAGSSNQATSVVRSQLLRTILALMSQSPSILGRYASRVPELGAALNSSSLTPRKRLGDREDRRRGGGGGRGTDGMLWAAVSARLQSSSGNGGVGSGVLRLRKRGGVKGAAGTQMAAAYPTKEEYGSMCRVSFAKLCRGVCASLLSETNGREADDATIDPPIAQFVRLANGVESLPYAGAAWVSAVTASAISGIGEEESLSASDNVALVRNAIAEIPAVSREIESKGDNAAVDLEGDHDEKKKHGPPPPRPGKDDEGRSRWSNDKEVVAARRAAKVLTLLLESPLSLKCDESFSLASKAD